MLDDDAAHPPPVSAATSDRAMRRLVDLLVAPGLACELT